MVDLSVKSLLLTKYHMWVESFVSSPCSMFFNYILHKISVQCGNCGQKNTARNNIH